jgi:hypothetical protein
VHGLPALTVQNDTIRLLAPARLRADVAIKFRSSFQNLFIKILALRCRGTDSHGWEAELGHVLEAEKRRLGVSTFTERYCCIRCGPTAPVLPELRADVRDQILLVNLFYQRILALQMQGTDSHGLGGRRNLVTYLRSRKKTTVGVAFTERYCIRVRPNGPSCQLRAMSRDQIPSSFQNLFYQRRYWLSDARYRFTWMGRQNWSRTCEESDGGCRPLPGDTASRCGPASCQSCVPMSAIKFARHFEPVCKEDIGSPDAGTDSHDWGRRWNLVTYL